MTQLPLKSNPNPIRKMLWWQKVGTPRVRPRPIGRKRKRKSKPGFGKPGARYYGPFSLPGLQEYHTRHAASVINAFGGAGKLQEALSACGHEYTLSTIYRWAYEKPRGSGGLIPKSAWKVVQLAALKYNLQLLGMTVVRRNDQNVYNYKVRKHYRKTWKKRKDQERKNK